MAADRAGKKPEQTPGDAPCPPNAGTGGRDAPPPVDVDLPAGLTAREAAAVEALLQQPTIARAAVVVEIHERTLRRWMAVPAFHAALQEARRAAFAQAIGLTQWYASVAVATLVKVMNDAGAPAHCRVSAAAALLRFGREGIELDDLAERVRTLEHSLPQPLPGPPAEAAAEQEEEDAL